MKKIILIALLLTVAACTNNIYNEQQQINELKAELHEIRADLATESGFKWHHSYTHYVEHKYYVQLINGTYYNIRCDVLMYEVDRYTMGYKGTQCNIFGETEYGDRFDPFEYPPYIPLNDTKYTKTIEEWKSYQSRS